MIREATRAYRSIGLPQALGFARIHVQLSFWVYICAGSKQCGWELSPLMLLELLRFPTREECVRMWSTWFLNRRGHLGPRRGQLLVDQSNAKKTKSPEEASSVTPSRLGRRQVLGRTAGLREALIEEEELTCDGSMAEWLPPSGA